MDLLSPKIYASDAPPDGLTRPLQAMWWLKKGALGNGPEWVKAHGLCQMMEGDPDHDIVHALAHWIEGDQGNADYWYRRAGSQPAKDIESEWNRIAVLLGAASKV